MTTLPPDDLATDQDQKADPQTNGSTDPDRDGDEPINPFDPVKLRADPGDDDIPTTRRILKINVRKPTKTEFFRVRPGEERTTDIYMIEAGDGIETDKFVVVPDLAREIIGETTKRRLFVCVNRAGTTFIWPAKLRRTRPTHG